VLLLQFIIEEVG